MPDPSVENRSHLRVILSVLAVVVAVAAVAAIGGLVSKSLPAPDTKAGGNGLAPAPPAVEDIGGPDDPSAPAIPAENVAEMRAELDGYVSAYGNVTDFDVLPIGDDGKPAGSRFAERVAPGTRFLADSGEQTPPVFAEVVVTRTDGSRFAALLAYRADSTGKLAWSDLLTSSIP